MVYLSDKQAFEMQLFVDREGNLVASYDQCGFVSLCIQPERMGSRT